MDNYELILKILENYIKNCANSHMDSYWVWEDEITGLDYYIDNGILHLMVNDELRGYLYYHVKKLLGDEYSLKFDYSGFDSVVYLNKKESFKNKYKAYRMDISRINAKKIFDVIFYAFALVLCLATLLTVIPTPFLCFETNELFESRTLKIIKETRQWSIYKNPKFSYLLIEKEIKKCESQKQNTVIESEDKCFLIPNFRIEHSPYNTPNCFYYLYEGNGEILMSKRFQLPSYPSFIADLDIFYLGSSDDLDIRKYYKFIEFLAEYGLKLDNVYAINNLNILPNDHKIHLITDDCIQLVDQYVIDHHLVKKKLIS